jgi:U3 small nucleolar RNA-associated protein 3
MLAFYLHLRSSAKYTQRPLLLQSHPILQRLLTLKQSLATLEDLDFAGSDSEGDEDDGSINMDDILADGEQVWRFDGAEGLEPNELAELLEDADSSAKKTEKRIQTPPKKKRKTTTQDHPQPVGSIFDLVEPQFVSSKSSSQETLANDADAYGEMTALHFADLADKSVRKKSLRFHTSKIDSTSARRQGARDQALGGDDDLPYRPRKRGKDTQLVKEAVKRLNNQGGDDLDDEVPEPSRIGEKRSRQDEDEADPDGYYELVKKNSKEKKEKKKAEYEEANGRVRYVLAYYLCYPLCLIISVQV